VRAHLAERISIEMLAELEVLSPFHFSRVFKQNTGMTPLQYVTRERMRQAQQLIREISRSLRNRARSRLHQSEPLRSGISADGQGLACNDGTRDIRDDPPACCQLQHFVEGDCRRFVVVCGILQNTVLTIFSVQ
jgi:Bacterial regulatory helix-turn-helix proteins, AraC family